MKQYTLCHALFTLILLLSACASPTHTVDAHPGLGDPQHNTYAYQAEDGSLAQATPQDASIAAAAATVDSALGMGDHSSPNLANRISGYCVMAGDKDTELPCSSILVKLVKKDGTEIGQQRVDETGHFFFNVNTKDRYRIQVPSDLFTAKISPNQVNHGLKAGSVVKVTLVKSYSKDNSKTSQAQ